MLFGLANTYTAFQSSIYATHFLYGDVFAISYLKIMVVYSNTMEEYREHVCTLLKTLLHAGLEL
jgi:hypothetical protein